MKKLIYILMLFVVVQVTAQEQTNWITDYKTALKRSKTQNKPILAFVTDHQKTEALSFLNTTFFNSEAFTKLASKVIFLKVDISDKQSYNVRLGIHYTKQTTAPGLALVDQYGDTLGEPLVTINAENIESFITFVNSKL